MSRDARPVLEQYEDRTAPAVLVSMPFDEPVAVGAAQAPGVWYTDRYAPAAFETASFMGGNVLEQSISAADGASSRPANYASAFYNTQGRKYDLPADSTALTVDLYVPSDWATSGRRMAGLWGTAFDATAAVSAYPIIEFTSLDDVDGSGARFRGWDDGTWVSMGLPTGFQYDNFYTLEITLDRVTDEFRYAVGDAVATVPANGSLQFGNVILQGHNTTDGVSYDIHWDNLSNNVAPTVPVDVDPAVNAVPENAAAGTPVGVTAFSADRGGLAPLSYSLTADASGRFVIDPVSGVVTVAAGAVLDSEIQPSHTITVRATDSLGTFAEQSFTIAVTGLSGRLYLDHNANGVRDAGEPAAAGRTVYLDLNSNGLLDDGEPTAATDAAGAYHFHGLADGKYLLRVDLEPGDLATSHPGGQLIDLTGGPVQAADMGVRHQLTVVPVAAIDTLFHPGDMANADEDVVAALYRAVMGRDADAAGLAAHVAALRQFGQGYVVDALWNSAEHRAIQVEAYYQFYLGRGMDTAGKGWVDALVAGAGEEAVAAGILGSAEFSARYASNEEFAKALYPLLLGRHARDTEYAAHVAALDAGLSREALVKMILADEPEATGHAVDALFSTSLERGADPSGMQTWSEALAGDAMSLGDLARALLSSEEFALRAHG